jgi:hypothetical protein
MLYNIPKLHWKFFWRKLFKNKWKNADEEMKVHRAYTIYIAIIKNFPLFSSGIYVHMYICDSWYWVHIFEAKKSLNCFLLLPFYIQMTGKFLNSFTFPRKKEGWITYEAAFCTELSIELNCPFFFSWKILNGKF